jgi:hypothetical protein
MDATTQTAVRAKATEGDGNNWIAVEDRLPSLGENVCVRFAKKNGEPRHWNPVKDADFVLYNESLIFCVYPNWYITPAHCLTAGITHWQPKVGNIAPSPLIDPADYPLRLRKMKINLSHEERERRADRMRNYWRKRRGESTAADSPSRAEPNPNHPVPEQ